MPDQANERTGWWHSLQWRLPLAISLLVMLILVIVIAAAHREVRDALAQTAGERAAGAARQVANVLEGVFRSSDAGLRNAATQPVFREFLQGPSPERQAAVAAALGQLAPNGPRIATLWDARGEKRAEVVVPAPADYSGPRDLPPPRPPESDGLQPLGLVDGGAYVDSVATVTDLYPSLTRIGFLSLRSPFIISPPGLFARLIGDAADVKVGNRDGSAWLDLGESAEQQGPPVALGADGVATYVSAGITHTGALVAVRDSPWVLWVDFSERIYGAPAWRFLRRMTAAGLLFAVAGVILSALLTRRVSRPLLDLTRATEAVAAGDYSRRVDLHRRDEIGRLGRAFDVMASKIEQDISERGRVAQTLQENEDRLRYTLSAARVGTWQMDLATQVVQWSETMGQLFGRPTSMLPTQRDEIASVIHPDDRAEVAECLLRAPGDRREHEIFFRALQPNGTFKWLVGRSRQLADSTGTLRLAGVCFDVTEQKMLEQQLQQARKMDAIGKLAGGVAHDFNNLLTVILGFGTDLLETMPADDPRRVNVQEILKAGGRAADLTAQLLAFSRQQLVQPVIVDVGALVRDTAVMLRRLIGEHIELTTVTPPGPATVRVDPVQLQQILMNLAINARDAMPSGGKLTIEIAAVELDSTYAEHHGPVTAGPYVLIAVTDTGVGLTEAVRSRMFEPFFTTKKRGEGTGLGLATVYGAVKQAGGYVWAYGEPGAGSTFKVYLPRVEGEATGERAAAQAEPARSNGETILLVEDEEAVRLLASMILERAGYRVVTAANGEEAESLHLSFVGKITLLLTDVVLPGSSGPDLFQRLSMRDPQLKVLYMSGYTDDAVFRTGRLQAGVAFIQKPFTADAIRRKIQEILAA